MRSQRRRSPMTKRQLAFAVICFLGGILVGMQIAGNLDVLVRLVIIVALLLLGVYLLLPFLPPRIQVRRRSAPRVQQRRAHRRP
jgi:hypothetical protein